VLSRAAELATVAGAATSIATLGVVMHKFLLPSLGVALAVALALVLPWPLWVGEPELPEVGEDPGTLLAREEPRGAAEPAGGSERAALVDAADPTSTAGILLPLQVVFDETGEPAPFAEVYFAADGTELLPVPLTQAQLALLRTVQLNFDVKGDDGVDRQWSNTISLRNDLGI